MILEELGGITLDHIVKDLLSFFNGFQYLHEAKRMIEKQCGIKKEPEHKCWSEDYIKQAWKETIKEDIKSSRRRHWARVIILQMVKSFVCDSCKQNAAEKNRDPTPDEQGCETTPNPEDRSSQRSAKPNTVESVRSVKRRLGENVSEASESEGASKKRKVYDTTYIRIPLTKLFGNISPSVPPKAYTKLKYKYKLIDGPPFTKKPDGTEIKNKQCYVMSYNNGTNNAEWVYEIMNMNTSPCYKRPQFQDSDSNSNSDSDSNDPSYQAPNSRNPFRNTDYDRGHLAAAANHMWCQEAYEDTYWMRNITPQNKNLNRGRWKALEKCCRDFVKDGDVRNVHVYTGPLYLRIEVKSGEELVPVLNRIEMNHKKKKAVPTHYFKVLIVEKKNGTVEEPQCFLIANKDGQIEEKKDIKSIESISGLKFTEDIPGLAEVDHIRTATWEGNKGGKSVTIDVRISSFKKIDVEPHSLNEE